MCTIFYYIIYSDVIYFETKTNMALLCIYNLVVLFTAGIYRLVMFQVCVLFSYLHKYKFKYALYINIH